jgi:hypothetical protein
MEVTWKSNPRTHIWMALKTLLIPLLRLAPGTCLAASQLVPAVLSCHDRCPCLYGSDTANLQADRISLTIRQLLAQAREAKKDLNLGNQLLRKAEHDIC